MLIKNREEIKLLKRYKKNAYKDKRKDIKIKAIKIKLV